jgi:hypothetical protein
MKHNAFKLLFIAFLIIGIAFILSHTQQSEDDLSLFLQPTKFIDSNNPKIITKAKELTEFCASEAEKARALFEFVRDTNNNNICESFVASEILECGGNSCRKRSILLAALCRAVGIPARLHLQRVAIKNWKNKDGSIEDIIFAHGLTGIYINGNWHLYESVGNIDKWIIWIQDENRASEAPVEFHPDRDCLFPSDDKIIIETLSIHFADRTEEMIKLIEKIDKGEY